MNKFDRDIERSLRDGSFYECFGLDIWRIENMAKKAEIKKIVLDLGEKEVELTLEQAKKLNSLLGEVFDEKTSYPSYPIVIERRRPYWWYDVWTCSTSDGTNITYSSEDNSVTYSIQ